MHYKRLLILLPLATAYSWKSRQSIFEASKYAPLFEAENAEIVPNKYIVVLETKANENATVLYNHLEKVNFQVVLTNNYNKHSTNNVDAVFKHSILGYSGSFDEELLNYIRLSPEVKYVERETLIRVDNVQQNAGWGLARISQRNRLGSSPYSYYYDSSSGAGVTAYILDTGINVNNVEFEGRARVAYVAIDGDVPQDLNGHGTHVAGTVGGINFGVAKKVSLVGIKVIGSNGVGSSTNIIKGIDFMINDHMQRSAGGNDALSVANLSVGSSYVQSLNDAVDAAVSKNIHFGVSAGNNNRDACGYSPASAQYAVAVGSIGISDNKSSFSNYGKCVSIFGPGENILSAGKNSNTDTATLSGTSMAAPHITGLMAYFLGIAGSPMSFFQMKSTLVFYATTGAISGLDPASPNLIAYNQARN